MGMASLLAVRTRLEVQEEGPVENHPPLLPRLDPVALLEQPALADNLVRLQFHILERRAQLLLSPEGHAVPTGASTRSVLPSLCTRSLSRPLPARPLALRPITNQPIDRPRPPSINSRSDIRSSLSPLPPPLPPTRPQLSSIPILPPHVHPLPLLPPSPRP